MEAKLRVKFCEELKEFGFAEEVFVRHTNHNRDMFKFALKEVSDIDERLSVNDYLGFEFSINDYIDRADCILTFTQKLFDFGDSRSLLIADGSRDIADFEINVEVVESSGDFQEDIRIMYEYLAEVIKEVVYKFSDAL